jgi:hypothetical protein
MLHSRPHAHRQANAAKLGAQSEQSGRAREPAPGRSLGVRGRSPRDFFFGPLQAFDGTLIYSEMARKGQ